MATTRRFCLSILLVGVLACTCTAQTLSHYRESSDHKKHEVTAQTTDNFTTTTTTVDCAVYFHLHIPKAGGTALASALTTSSNLVSKCQPQRKYQTKSCASQLLEPSCLPPAHQQAKIGKLQSRLTTGWECGVHPSLQKIQNCVKLPFFKETTSRRYPAILSRIVTMLRHPLARIQSEYHHCQTAMKGECWGYTLNISTASLQDFVAMDNSQPFRNRQMKYLSGCSVTETDWKNPEAADKCFAKAKDNIDHFFFFTGISEHFDASLHLLNSKMSETMTGPDGNTHADYKYNANSTRTENKLVRHYDNELGEELESFVLEQEHYDLELYNYAKTHFWDEFAMIPS